jgi:hypothetical protein
LRYGSFFTSTASSVSVGASPFFFKSADPTAASATSTAKPVTRGHPNSMINTLHAQLTHPVLGQFSKQIANHKTARFAGYGLGEPTRLSPPGFASTSPHFATLLATVRTLM